MEKYIKSSVRVLDDFLEGGQNESVYGLRHIASARKIFGCNLMMFCSDFSMAFKQIFALESVQKNTVIVHWDLVRAMPAYMIPLKHVVDDLFH